MDEAASWDGKKRVTPKLVEAPQDDAGFSAAVRMPIDENYTQEEQEIIDLAQKDGSHLKAPNGKKSELTPKQWAQVRTAAFKNWFGDWETLAKIMAVRGMEAVAVTPHESLDKNQMKEAFHGFGDVENKRSGRVAKFPSKSAGKIFYHKGFDSSSIVRHMAVLFEDSVLAFSENETPREGHKEHRNYESYEQYVNKFSVNGDEYFIRFTVPIVRNSKESANVHSTAISQVTIYRKGDSVLYLPETAGKAESPLADKKLASFFASVNEKDVSKVVDENGEPLVVYHGTPQNFGNVFADISDREWRLQYDINYEADTYWFADKEFTAQTYQIGLYVYHGTEKRRVHAAHRNLEPLQKEDVTYTFIKRRMKNGFPDDSEISAGEAFTKQGTLKKNCRAELRLKEGRKTPQGYEGLRGMIVQYNDATEANVKTPSSLEEAVAEWNASLEFEEIEVPVKSRLYSCFLNLRNPQRIDAMGEKFSWMGDKARRAKASGHDGLIVDNVRDPGAYPIQIENGASIAVFAPTQIKSATDNRGMFDANDADITHALRFSDSSSTSHGALSAGRMAFARTIAENVSKMLNDEIVRFRSFDGKVQRSREKALVAIGAVYNMAHSVSLLTPARVCPKLALANL